MLDGIHFVGFGLHVIPLLPFFVCTVHTLSAHDETLWRKDLERSAHGVAHVLTHTRNLISGVCAS